MKKRLIHFAKIAILIGCSGLASCASEAPRPGPSSNPIHRPASRARTSERYYNAATDNWEFEPGS